MSGLTDAAGDISLTLLRGEPEARKLHHVREALIPVYIAGRGLLSAVRG